MSGRPTAREVVAGVDLSGRTALVTGPTSGIGTETARALAWAGAHVILAARDEAASGRLAEMLSAEAGGGVSIERLDLSDLHSVANASARLVSRHEAIDLLIANAGASKTPNTHTADGLDVRFAGNHLGHFLLAQRLLPALTRRGARIVMLSSAAHKGRAVNFEDPAWTKRPHEMFAAYGESKTANILFAIEATRRWGGQGVFANAVLPGSILTGLQRYHGDELKRAIGFVDADGRPNPILKTVEEGAATSVWAAVAPELAGRGGLVLEDCAEAQPAGSDTHPWSGYDPAVLSEADAARLWELSERMIEEVLARRA